MAQTIKLKRSSTGGNVPATGDLALGEMAINTNDGLMFIKKDVSGTETICTFHPTIDSGGVGGVRTLSLDKGSGLAKIRVDFPSATLSGNTYIDGNGGRIESTSAGMFLSGAGNLGLYSNGAIALGNNSTTSVHIGGNSTATVTISTTDSGYCKLPGIVRFDDGNITDRTDNPNFEMKLEEGGLGVSNLTFTEGLRLSSYAFGVLHQNATDAVTPGVSYSYTVAAMEGTTQLKIIGDFWQDRTNSQFYMQPYTSSSTGMTVKGNGDIELGASNSGFTYPEIRPWSSTRGYIGKSNRYWYNLYTYYATIVGLTVSSFVKLSDYDYLYLGTSNDVRIFYNGNATTNTLFMELESACTNFKITDNGTERFTFAKSSGDFTATGNVTAYSDERLKSDIKTLDPNKTLQMRGVEFIKDGKKGSGVIAQELEKVAPELVLDKGDYKSVAYGNLSGYLIETIKDQQTQIDELKELVNKLLEK